MFAIFLPDLSTKIGGRFFPCDAYGRFPQTEMDDLLNLEMVLNANIFFGGAKIQNLFLKFMEI